MSLELKHLNIIMKLYGLIVILFQRILFIHLDEKGVIGKILRCLRKSWKVPI